MVACPHHLRSDPPVIPLDSAVNHSSHGSRPCRFSLIHQEALVPTHSTPFLHGWCNPHRASTQEHSITALSCISQSSASWPLADYIVTVANSSSLQLAPHRPGEPANTQRNTIQAARHDGDTQLRSTSRASESEQTQSQLKLPLPLPLLREKSCRGKTTHDTRTATKRLR